MDVFCGRRSARTDGLGRALYETFDAKAHAEHIKGVGLGWDARIIIGERIISPPRTIKSLVEAVFETSNQTPFKRRPPRHPRRWRQTLESYGRGLMKKYAKRQA